MGFLEAIQNEEQIKNAVKVLAPMPVSRHTQSLERILEKKILIEDAKLMINFVSNGKTPWFQPETLGQWGVKVSSHSRGKTPQPPIS